VLSVQIPESVVAASRGSPSPLGDFERFLRPRIATLGRLLVLVCHGPRATEQRW